jgi:chromosome segregation ATPase
LRQQVEGLRQELTKLTTDEDVRRKTHNFSRIELQETWDKLVNLRGHLAAFRSSIEDMTIEALAADATAAAEKRLDLQPKPSSVYSSLESASKLADISALREKIRQKEQMRTRVAALENNLGDVRRQLATQSDALTSLKGSVSGTGHIYPPDACITSTRLARVSHNDLDVAKYVRFFSVCVCVCVLRVCRVDGYSAPASKAVY